jgi:hypothetical protein
MARFVPRGTRARGEGFLAFLRYDHPEDRRAHP